jgi:hypothetical protein
MANFAIHLGISPTEYYSLTLIQREALIEVYEEKVKAMNKR